MGGYFRHQETRDIARKYCEHPDHPHPGYNPDYKPWRNPLHIILTLFLLTFLLVPLYFALFTEEIIGAVSDIGWEEVTWLMIVGLLVGFGIGKCGFGTECAVMAPESTLTKPDFYRNNGVPMATYAMFRGMLPLQGDQGLYWGHILGGPLLAMGAVFMIGCEVRTYARLGMGYATALAALPGFYIGYLPYTLYYEQIDEVVFGEGLTDFITIPEWAAYTLGGTEYAWAIVYSLFLIGILIFSFEYGRRFLKTRLDKLIRSNTDQLVYEASAK
jgi:hypothetical protein